MENQEQKEVQSTVNVVNVEIAKLSLQPNDKLLISLKSHEIDLAFLDSFRKGLKKLFPSNEVGVIALDPDGDMKITIVNNPSASYCSDCSCGKKEAAERKE